MATIAIEILATMAQYSIVVALALLRAAHKKRPNVASHQDPLVLNRRARLFMGGCLIAVASRTILWARFN